MSLPVFCFDKLKKKKLEEEKKKTNKRSIFVGIFYAKQV
jgi:hypothetical protein